MSALKYGSDVHITCPGNKLVRLILYFLVKTSRKTRKYLDSNMILKGRNSYLIYATGCKCSPINADSVRFRRV